MNTVMENSSIVIIAKDFNPSIFKSLWLVKNNIFREDELEGNIVITPPAVQIPSTNFQFVVLPDRIQFTVPRKYPDVQSDITRILGGIVTTLPHTPYTAVGLNFHFLVAPESEDSVGKWEKTLFASPIYNKFPEAEDHKARFGSYISFDALESRLKIDIKPTNAGNKVELLCKTWRSGQELTRIHFNFHTDVANMATPSESVLEKLNKWTEALTLSQKLRDKIINVE